MFLRLERETERIATHLQTEIKIQTEEMKNNLVWLRTRHDWCRAREVRRKLSLALFYYFRCVQGCGIGGESGLQLRRAMRKEREDGKEDGEVEKSLDRR